MSEQTYTPRPGSKAEAAIIALTATKWLSKAELAEEIECELANVDGNLKLAVDHGLIRKVARDGKAGFMLGGSDAPPQDDEAEPVKRARPKKVTKAAPAPRQVERKPKPNGDYIEYGHHVGICQDGRVVVIDGDGHVLELTAEAARRVAELVARYK